MVTVNVYELVKEILDETYAELEGTEAERDARIKTALSQLSAAYGGLKSSSGPSYDDPATRLGADPLRRGRI